MGLVQEGDFTIAWKGEMAIVHHLPTDITMRAIGGTKAVNLMDALDAMEKLIQCSRREEKKGPPKYRVTFNGGGKPEYCYTNEEVWKCIGRRPLGTGYVVYYGETYKVVEEFIPF